MARASKPSVPLKEDDKGIKVYAAEINAFDKAHDDVIDDYVSQTDTTNQNVASNLIFGAGKGPDALGTKKVDEAAIADGKVVMYKSASGKLEYDTPPGGGGASDVATYITKDDETVALPNSIQHQNIVEANKHTPKAHTHLEADITDLDHDATKIATKTVDLAGIATGQFLQYDGVKFIVNFAPKGPYEFEVFPVAGTYYRRDDDGNQNSGASPATIINDAFTNLTAARSHVEVVHVKGDI